MKCQIQFSGKEKKEKNISKCCLLKFLLRMQSIKESDSVLLSLYMKKFFWAFFLCVCACVRACVCLLFCFLRYKETNGTDLNLELNFVFCCTQYYFA